MKTRKLAAKALSVAVVATTVSGYAMAGDHSISADPSFVPWCNITYKQENTTGAGNTAPQSANGSCAKGGDVAIKFSGKVKGGWDYYFDIDPSNGLDGATLGVNTGDIMGSVVLTKSLGNGLTLKLGDVGDGDQLKNYAGHWEAATHSDPNSVGGGAQLGYSKSGLSATFSYGGNTDQADVTGGSNIAVGANYAFGKFDVGASYHTRAPSDRGKNFATNADGDILGVTSNSMTFGAGGSFGNYSFGVDYLSRTDEAQDALGDSVTDIDKTKITAMGVHLWTTAGTWRPGLSYVSETKDFTDADNAASGNYKRKSSKIGAGVAWHPANSDANVKFIYSSVSDDQCAATPCAAVTGVNTTEYSKMELSVGTSVTIL